MNKKGIFFTFIAVVLMGLFIVVYTPPADITLQKDTQSVRARISTLNNLVNDMEYSYFVAVLRATAHKSLSSLILYMNSTGTYLQNFDSAFAEVMVNGTLNGVQIDSITQKKIMENSTLSNWSSRIIDASRDTFNANASIKIIDVSARQTRPWSIDLALTIDLEVRSNVAMWSMSNVTVFASLPVEGFDDPHYLVNTNGLYSNNIKASGLQFNKWNISHVREHVRNGTYVHWQGSQAPSFLMRFTNNMANSSCCGIESLVNPNKISSPDRIESYADYAFWNHTYSSQCPLLYNITNPSTGGGIWDEFRYFKLDIYSMVRYNVTGQDAVQTC